MPFFIMFAAVLISHYYRVFSSLYYPSVNSSTDIWKRVESKADPVHIVRAFIRASANLSLGTGWRKEFNFTIRSPYLKERSFGTN
jgi:hypothetical protein